MARQSEVVAKPPIMLAENDVRITHTMTNWDTYHKKTAALLPRSTLLKALAIAPAAGHAVDLGCGSGRDTIHLLDNGWTVLAIDNQQTAIDRIQLPPSLAPRCSMMLANFEEAELGRA